MVFKNLIFDIDGTIIDSYDQYMFSLRDSIFEVTGKKISDKDLNYFFHLSFNETYKKLNLSKEDELKVKQIDNEKIMNFNLEMFSGIEEVLRILKSKNIFIAINSSRITNEIDQFENIKKLRNYSKIVVTSDLVKNPKPDPESVDLILNKFNLKKEDTLFVGDSKSDSLCSINSGIKFALASWGARDKNIKYDIYLNEPKDILKYIK